MWIQFLLILYLGSDCNGMLVKSWGTGMRINWLRWSINDIFNEAIELMTLGQKGVYPIKGFNKTFNTSDGKLVHFETYNGWLENLQLEDVNSARTDLRRVIMTRAERYLHEKAAGIKDNVKDGSQEKGGHQHEMIICLECMAISIARQHYAFQAEMNTTDESNTEPILYWTAGTLQTPQAIILPITFQMSIMISHIHGNVKNEQNINKTIQPSSKKQCTILLEPIQLSTWPKFWPTKATRIGRFNFLSDHVNTWLELHFNNSTLEELRTSLDTSVRRVLHTRNVCLEILLKPSDYDHV